jgi:hypothetical protein
MRIPAVASFVIGALVFVGSGVNYLTTIESIELKRQEQEDVLARGKGAVESLLLMKNVALTGSLAGTSVNSPGDLHVDWEQVSDIDDKVAEWNLAMVAANEELTRLDHRAHSTRRTSIIGAALGLFLSLIQAPFLLLAIKDK